MGYALTNEDKTVTQTQRLRITLSSSCKMIQKKKKTAGVLAFSHFRGFFNLGSLLEEDSSNLESIFVVVVILFQFDTLYNAFELWNNSDINVNPSDGK